MQAWLKVMYSRKLVKLCKVKYLLQELGGQMKTGGFLLRLKNTTLRFQKLLRSTFQILP